MSNDESFLARWFRRKHGAALNTCDKQGSENVGDMASEASPASFPPNEPQLPFDPARLPSIESIDAGSDVRAFLAPSVPAELTRAALRRAWSADPTIRDFIGLSENSWDFNAPGGVPGFGSMTAGDARRLLGEVMGEPDTADSARPLGATVPADQATVSASDSGPALQGSAKDQLKQDLDASVADADTAARGRVGEVAMPHELAERETCWSSFPRHRHGSALPK
jgi:hypothetical protein